VTALRLRVAVDGRALTELVGGLRRYAEEVLSRLPSLGDDLDWNLITQRPVSSPHIDYSMTVLPGSLNALLRPLWEDFRLAAALNAEAADVFFSPYGFVPEVPIPVVAMVHDLLVLRFPAALPWSHRRYWKRVAQALPRARRVITNSASTAADVAALTTVPRDQITVTHLAPAAVFAPAEPALARAFAIDLGLEKSYVLAIGTGTLRKELAPVAEALASLPDLELVTVGRTPRGIASRHLGVVDDETLSILMSAAVAVVCPSKLEGFGLPVVEAMACGAPVVASRTPAVEEVSNGAAILVSQPDPSAWLDALQRLCSDPHLRGAHIEAGLARSTEFSWDTTAAATLEVIRSAAAGG
jgi:glycosyltransferase involved in cell wall biosynthesis